ncbi:MAG: hypothetical protein RJB66_2113 [Pseudomonadota bacterium]|jgi:probable rRNA maturation factor
MPRLFINAWLRAVESELIKRKILGRRPQELTIVFMSSGPAKKLNLQFRNKNYATDVLSFDGGVPGVLGELVICPEVVKRQSIEHSLSFQQELGYMLLHGVLHLLGFDHERSKKEARLMFELQDDIFDKLCRKFWN